MTMKSGRVLVAAAVAVVGVWGSGAAWAAAPSNDTADGAVAITSLPFDATVDVSQATTDADDTALNQQCGAPATLGSVWYSYTAPSDGTAPPGVVLDVSQSSYSAGVIVAESDGSGGWYVDTCGPGTVGFQVVPGAQYRILAFNDTPGATGGSIVLHASVATVPPPTLITGCGGPIARLPAGTTATTWCWTNDERPALSSTLRSNV